MSPIIWYPLLTFIGTFGGALLCFPLTRRIPWRWLLATAVYLAIDDAVLLRGPHIFGLHRNWLGKAASVLLAFIAMRMFQLSRTEMGLRLPRRASWGWFCAALALMVVWAVAGVRGMYRQHAELETLLYQATMPALSEEFAYRGVAFAILVRAFGDERRGSTLFATVLITSLCFALGHLEPPTGLLPLEFIPTMIRSWALQFGSKFLLGGLLACLRWRSGSLLGPVFAHGASNLAGTVALARV